MQTSPAASRRLASSMISSGRRGGGRLGVSSGLASSEGRSGTDPTNLTNWGRSSCECGKSTHPALGLPLVMGSNCGSIDQLQGAEILNKFSRPKICGQMKQIVRDIRLIGNSTNDGAASLRRFLPSPCEEATHLQPSPRDWRGANWPRSKTLVRGEAAQPPINSTNGSLSSCGRGIPAHPALRPPSAMGSN